jgi:hypothetical protein
MNKIPIIIAAIYNMVLVIKLKKNKAMIVIKATMAMWSYPVLPRAL